MRSEAYSVSSASEKMKKKKKEEDDNDDSDDEMPAKKGPSKWRLFSMTTCLAVIIFAVMYFQVNPVVTVPIAGLFGTNVKSITRKIGRKKRYIFLGICVVNGWCLDALTGYKFSFGPIATSAAISALSRTQKLFILGKMHKDR